jgi:hypothetical protein
VTGPSQNLTSRAEYATTIPLPPTSSDEEAEATPAAAVSAASEEKASTNRPLDMTSIRRRARTRHVGGGLRRRLPRAAAGPRSGYVFGTTFQLLSIDAMSTKYSVW